MTQAQTKQSLAQQTKQRIPRKLKKRLKKFKRFPSVVISSAAKYIDEISEFNKEMYDLAFERFYPKVIPPNFESPNTAQDFQNN